MNNQDGIREEPNVTNVEVRNQDCGIGRYRPKWLQWFRTEIWALFWLSCAAAIQGMAVNGLVNAVISSTEKRFGLSSSQSGLVVGAYNIASFICVVPVSYYGGHVGQSKPLWIGLGLILIGLGTLLFALPHAVVGLYQFGNQEPILCRENASDRITCQKYESTNFFSQTLVMTIFIGSQFIKGVGSTPLYTMGVSYLHENVPKRMSSIYLGVYYTASVLGPALGFWLGAKSLEYYIDFTTIKDPESLGLTPDSRVWIGAWWLGHVIVGILAFVLVFPNLALPRSFPGSDLIRQEMESEPNNRAYSQQPVSFQDFQQLPLAIRQLVCNPSFTFLCFAGACESFLVTGFLSFMPKFFENEYSLTASQSSIILGGFTIPAAGGGLLLGGYLVKIWDLSCEGIQRLCVTCAAITLILSFSFLLYCSNPKIAGLTAPYAGSPDPDLIAPCNAACGCSRRDWEPICGVDGLTYYSPCHAGCRTEYKLKAKKVYTDCSCVKSPLDGIKAKFQPNSFSSSNMTHYDAVNISCESTCGNLYIFVALCFFIIMLSFVPAMPAISATLRYVRVEQQTFALGIQWLIVRIFGNIPGPIIFGAIIDKACILWEDDGCGNIGSCYFYDNINLGRFLLGILGVGKLCSLIFFVCAWKITARQRP